MADLEYSLDAQNIIHKFYHTDIVMYVEGLDDVVFWEVIFNKFSTLNIEIKEVGGATALRAYMNNILSGDLLALVACDSDLSILDEDRIEHENIIRTHGYSIENTLICEKTISKIIMTLGKLSQRNIPIDEIRSWISDSYNLCIDLVRFDIFNYHNSLGIHTGLDNANRFMNSRNSYSLCQDKIREHLSELMNGHEVYDERLLCELIESKNINLPDLVRGHFIFSATLKFISVMIKKIDRKICLSNESLYSSLILAFESIFNSQHPEYNYYKNCVENVQVN